MDSNDVVQDLVPSIDYNLPKMHGQNLIDISDEHPPRTFLGRTFWCAPTGVASRRAIAVFCVFPFLLCLIAAATDGTLYMDEKQIQQMDEDDNPVLDENGTVVMENVPQRGFMEDYTIHSLFISVILMAPLSLWSMQRLPITIESLSNIVRLDKDTEDSTLTKQELDELINTYSLLYCNATGREIDGLNYPKNPELQLILRKMKIIKYSSILLAVIVYINVVYMRTFTPEVVSGTWETVGLGLFARSIADLLVMLIFMPIILYTVSLGVLLTNHSLTKLESRNGIRFMRFSMDEAGGLGAFGIQSFSNMLVLAPISLIVAGILVQTSQDGAPITVSAILGIVVYCLLLVVIFLYPLLGAIRSMSKLKKMELAKVSAFYVMAYEKFINEMNNEQDMHQIQTYSETMIAAEEVFAGILRQPTVPYSSRLAGALAAVLGPIFGGLGALLFG